MKRSRRLRGGTTLATVVLLLAAAPVGASTPTPGETPAADRVVLGETNVLEGDMTGRVAVHIPRAATLDLTPLRDTGSDTVGPAALQAEGGAGYVGFFLNEAGSTEGFMAVAVRTPEALVSSDGPVAASAYARPAIADRESLSLNSVTGEPPTCTMCNVPPGDYDLVLITDGEPARVTLTLGGLTGQRHIAPEEEPVSFQSTSRPPMEGPAEASTYGSGGRGRSWTIPLTYEPNEPGVLIDSYSLAVNARNQVPAAVTTATDCRDAGTGEECDEHLLVGGNKAVSGLVASPGRYTRDGVSTSFSWDTTGDVTYRMRHDYMWLSTGSIDAANTEADTPPHLSHHSVTHRR